MSLEWGQPQAQKLGAETILRSLASTPTSQPLKYLMLGYLDMQSSRNTKRTGGEAGIYLNAFPRKLFDVLRGQCR
jgi:hypothetical protein